MVDWRHAKSRYDAVTQHDISACNVEITVFKRRPGFSTRKQVSPYYVLKGRAVTSKAVRATDYSLSYDTSGRTFIIRLLTY